MTDQVVCPICGLHNEGRARFCRNCGLPMGSGQDPVRGTRSRKPDLPGSGSSGLAVLVGLVAAIVVLVGAGALLLGFAPGSPSATPILPPTAAPAEATASPDPFAPSFEPVVEPSAGPDEPPASAEPLVADTGFTCDPSGIDDPTGGSWRVVDAAWEALEKNDRLVLTLERVEGERATRVEIERLASRDAELISGLAAPTTDLSLLLTFNGGVTAKGSIVETPGLKAIDYVNVETSPASETLYAVVGVAREGCFRLSSPEWKKGKPVAVGETVRLIVDVRFR